MSSSLPADPDAVAFQQFDAEDDQQILAEIQGRNLEILDRMVYSYSDRRGHTVTGLSLTGVRETVREMNRRGLARIKITAAPPIIRETDDYIDAIVYAEDELNGGGSWGTKRQAKQVGSYANPFALEQALSKAQRNAMFALIPAAYVVEMIKEYAGQGRAKALTGPSGAVSGESRRLPSATPSRPPEASTVAPATTSDPSPWSEQDAEERAAAPPAVTPQHRMQPEVAISDAQMKLLQKLFKDLEITDEQKAALKGHYGIEHWPELSKRQATDLIDKLLRRRERTEGVS